MTVPFLQVHVGLAGTDTPTSDATAVGWNQAIDDLELGDGGGPVEITWGRSDEISQADPNTCSLTFAAAEFRSDPDGPYAVLETTGRTIVIGQPIRVRGQTPTVRQRFFGYISSITPLWPDGDVDHLRVLVQAESRLTWLGRAKNLQDRTSAALLAAGATSYWPMTEVITDDNNIADPSPPWFEFDEQPPIRVMGNNVAGLEAAFGWQAREDWGPAPDGLPVANFEIAPQPLVGDSQIDAAQVSPIPELGATSAWTVSFIARSGRGPLIDSRKFIVFALRGRDDLGFYSATNSQGYLQMAWFATDDSPYWSIGAYDSSDAFVDATIGVTGDNAPRDKQWHLYTMTSSGGATPTVRIYRDGTEVSSLAFAAGEMAAFNSISVGNMSYTPDVDGSGDPIIADNPRHEFGRLAIIDGTALSGMQITDLHETIIASGLGEGDTVDERIERWYELAGFGDTPIQTGTNSGTPLITQQIEDASPLQLMQEVAATDGGILFDEPSSAYTKYHARTVRLKATTAATLDLVTQEVEASLTTPVDLADLVNSVTVRAADDSAAVTRTDGASVALYGYSGEEQTLYTNSQAYLLGRADWRLHASSVPRPRAPELSIELAGLSEAQTLAVLALGMWSVVTVSGLPSDMDGVPASFFVEGATESWGHQSVRLSFNVTDATAELGTFILDDTTRGDLDSVYVLS